MTDPLFRLHDVHFAYEAGRPVLGGVDLTVSAGERIAIDGANGAGKTTLLLLMVGLLLPTAGRVFAFGHDRTREADFREVRARAGLLFQDADDQLFCPTVGEDVAFGPLNIGKSRDEARALTARTLASLGLAGFATRITHKLSGGEKRMVALATVLAMEPAVLLLDEPTAALDEASRHRLLSLLQTLPQAMVIVSHDREVRQRLATRHLVMANGRLVAA